MGDTGMGQSVQERAEHFESAARLAPSAGVGRAEALVPQPDLSALPARTPGIALTIERGVKRIVDYVGTGLGLLLISPFLIVVAALIKLD